MQLRYLPLDQPLGPVPVGVFRRNCLVNISWSIVITWTNHCGWDLRIRRSGSTFRALRISQLLTSSCSVTQWTLLKKSNFCHTWCNTESLAVFEGSRFRSTQRWSSRNAAFAFPIRVSTSLFWLPSLVNEKTSGIWTSRHGAAYCCSTCCSVRLKFTQECSLDFLPPKRWLWRLSVSRMQWKFGFFLKSGLLGQFLRSDRIFYLLVLPWVTFFAIFRHSGSFLSTFPTNWWDDSYFE